MPLETIVFYYETAEHRAALFDLIEPYNGAKIHDGLRVVALSPDNEIRRVGLIEEALERRDTRSNIEITIEDICACPDITKWRWPGGEA